MTVLLANYSIILKTIIIIVVSLSKDCLLKMSIQFYHDSKLVLYLIKYYAKFQFNPPNGFGNTISCETQNGGKLCNIWTKCIGTFENTILQHCIKKGYF